MNVLTCLGRLTADAEQRYTQAGMAILSFTVANDVGFGDRKQTNFYRCSMFGKRAEGGLVSYLKKGTQVVISGSHVVREYDKNDGTKGWSSEINVKEISLAGSKGQQNEPKPQQQPKDDFEDDDLPF